MLVVCKVGSSTLVGRDGQVDRDYIRTLASQVAKLVVAGHKVVIVSSGAAAAGMGRLGFSERPKDMPSLQACAAAGQAALTETYAEVLMEQDIPCAQVLLTRRDVTDRAGYLNTRTTFARLLELGAVPVVNENDTVSVTEFAFGENDMLGAMVSALVGADLYVICSDVEGLYTANPHVDPDARIVERVERVDAQLMEMASGSSSGVGSGGMVTKLRAARAMMVAGIPQVICQGRTPDLLPRIVAGERIGTRFEPPTDASHGAPKKLWIGLAEASRGSITLDAGACRAVLDRGASILPVGIVATSGSYEEGDVVDVMDGDGETIGRGVVRYSSDDMVRIRGLKLDIVARFMPDKEGQPAIHRDELLVF